MTHSDPQEPNNAKPNRFPSIRRILWITFSIISVVIATYYFPYTIPFWFPLCNNHEISEAISPDGQHKLLLRTEDCPLERKFGVIMVVPRFYFLWPYSTLVQRDAEFERDAGAFELNEPDDSARIDSIRFSWADSRSVTIWAKKPPGPGLCYLQHEIDGIRVTYYVVTGGREILQTKVAKCTG